MSRFFLVLSIPTLLLACSSAPPRADQQSQSGSDDSAALRALATDEVIGSIGYGETKSGIAYTETPTYRALSFEGSTGDHIVIDVSADNADARAWLLDASFKTITANDDASGSTLDAHIAKKLTKSGRYYIAFREKSFEDASFSVSLALANVPPPPPPPPPPSARGPFSTAYCKGSAMTNAEAVGRFAPGGTSAEVGNIQLVSRSRDCTSVTGCTSWTESDRNAFSNGGPNRAWFLASPTRGKLQLDVVDSTVFASVILDAGGDGQTGPTSQGTMLEGGIDGAIAGFQRLPWAQWSGARDLAYEGPDGSSITGHSGILTNHCVRYVVTTRSNRPNREWTEYEHVYYGSY